MFPFSRKHRHKPVESIYWIDGRKQYGEVCECGATRYMTIAALFPNANKNDIWTGWNINSTWSKFRPKENKMENERAFHR